MSPPGSLSKCTFKISRVPILVIWLFSAHTKKLRFTMKIKFLGLTGWRDTDCCLLPTLDVGEREASVHQGTLEGDGGLDLAVLQGVLTLPHLKPFLGLLFLSDGKKWCNGYRSR